MNGLFAIRKLLIDDSAVSALVSTKVFPGMVPEGTAMPCIYLKVDSVDPTISKSSNSDLDRYMITLQCMAETMSEANSIGEAVRDVLDYYSGDVTLSNGTTTIRRARITDFSNFTEEEVSRTIHVIEHEYEVDVKRTAEVTL